MIQHKDKNETVNDNAGLETRAVIEQLNNNAHQEIVDQVAQEVPIAFAYNGQSHAVMMASPLDLNNFAVGFSLTERIIDSPEQIKHIEINQARGGDNYGGFAINIRIAAELMDRLDQQRRQISGRSGCGVCGISDLANAIPKLEPVTKRAKPAHDVIARALASFTAKQDLQRLSGATHAAALYNQNGDLLELREDIGRHNALDKLVGARLAKNALGINDNDFIVLSSRASHELINKTVIAGVGSLICISAATSLAIDLASQLKLNLVGFVRNERQLIYHQNIWSLLLKQQVNEYDLMAKHI